MIKPTKRLMLIVCGIWPTVLEYIIIIFITLYVNAQHKLCIIMIHLHDTACTIISLVMMNSLQHSLCMQRQVHEMA